MTVVEFVTSIRCQTGESPVWDNQRRRLYWLDIPVGVIHALEVDSHKTLRWQVPGPIGSMGLCVDGGLVLGLQSGVHLFNPDDGALRLLVDPEQGRPNQRLNDGKVGPDGAFWVGSMSIGVQPAPANGTLYRVTADGKAEAKVTGLLCPNGLAWSGDGTTMFHSDSRGQWIDRYQFDRATGSISNPVRIATPSAEQGRPDGAATDVEGCYWSAGVSAGCLNRFSPDGILLESIPLSVSAPTMPCFAGDDMKTLYITSLIPADGRGLLAGALLRLRLPVAGVPIHRFG